MINSLYFFNNPFVFVPLLIWAFFWKGCALWIASKHNQKVWFLVLLVVNTFGILEIVYIFAIAKKNWNDLAELVTKW